MTTAFFSHPDCLLHEMGAGHPECPARLQAIDDQLISSRLNDVVIRESAPVATLDALRRVHDSAYLDALQAAIPPIGYTFLDPDTAVNRHSWQAALRAAGAVIAATDAVLDGRFRNAFCNVRPPGHHAEMAAAMGFCLLNNIAIAVRHALDVRGLERVAVIDFDVHHGNGTEAAFRRDPRVLMCSFFQHPFYPYSGTTARADNMLNTPLAAGSGGAAVFDLVQREWLPRLRAFAPQMVFISAGFDAHREDKLANMTLNEADYARLTTEIGVVANECAQGRIVSCLEGGYDLSALGRSVVAHLRVLADV